MWIADGWKDYELLDCGGGEKLERWGQQILVRPDPQAIWETDHKNPGWRQANARYSRSSTGGGHWDKHKLPEQWPIRYRDLCFQVKPMNFKHTGLFPEQAANWDFAMEKIRNAGRPGPGAEPVCLYRRGYGRLRGGRRQRLPCGRGAGHGRLGQGKRQELRTGGCADPLDRGRLRQICRAGDSPGQAL